MARPPRSAMNITGALRAIAILVALTAIADPSCTRQVSTPVPIVVRAASFERAERALAASVSERLASDMQNVVDVNSSGEPAAVIVAGQVRDVRSLPAGVPISIVTDTAPRSRNVSIVGTSGPSVMLTGWTAQVSAAVLATGMRDRTSTIVLEHEGVELDRVEHRWTADLERFQARFSYVPPGPGVRRMRISARALEGESTEADNSADLPFVTGDRLLRVLVYEPRPSWASSFIRRVLEDDPIFDVAGLVRPTRGVEISSSSAPARLVPEKLEPFDLVIVGAPEELGESDIDALTLFARLRGGGFILAPDRRPTGPYTKLIPADSFQERLLDNPAVVTGPSAAFRASEIAVPVRMQPGVDELAVLQQPKGEAPVVIAWPVGAGQGMFAGALDAWRYRAQDEGFARFWRAQAAAAAARAPRRIEATVNPGVASPGQLVNLRVHVRATEFTARGDSLESPALSATLDSSEGSAEPIRLWPAAEPGLFEGSFRAPEAGRCVVRVSSGTGAALDTTLIVASEARVAAPDTSNSLRLLSEATGGVMARKDDVTELESRLRTLPRTYADRSVWLARSGWWMAAFVLALSAEWGVRRRGGRR